MKKFLVLALIIACISSGLDAQTTVYLKKYLGHLKQTEVIINGKKFNMLFDSGGGSNIISPEVADLLGLKVYGSEIGFRMNGEKVEAKKTEPVEFRLGNFKVKDSAVNVWDLMSILPKGLPKLDGVISMNAFKDKMITIDIVEEKIIVETAASFAGKTKSLYPIPIKTANGISGNELDILMPVQHNQTTYWLLFDTGNLSTVILNKSWDEKQVVDSVHDVSLQFTCGNQSFSAVTSFKPLIRDGALNFETIKQYVFYFDLKRKTGMMKKRQ